MVNGSEGKRNCLTLTWREGPGTENETKPETIKKQGRAPGSGAGLREKPEAFREKTLALKAKRETEISENTETFGVLIK